MNENEIFKLLKRTENLITIESLEQYIEEIFKLTHRSGKEIVLDPDSKKTFFYRGESSLYQSSFPSIYRSKKYYENEKSILLDYISSGASELRDEETNFNIVSKIQHYQGLTRMLDVTSNALTALFFASSATSQDGEMGSVQIFFGYERDHNKIDNQLNETLYKVFSINDYFSQLEVSSEERSICKILICI